MPTGTGIYGGRTAEERRVERRTRLVESASAIWAEQGWAAVSMRGVCAHAGLVDRYFYESFANRDALLVAVWEQARDDIADLIVDAMTGHEDDPFAALRAAVAAVVGHIDDSPERARIVLADCSGCEPLTDARARALETVTNLLLGLARPYLTVPDDLAVRMTTLLAVGGFVELVTAWKDGRIETDAETVVEHVAGMATLLARQYIAER
ncbi:TetR/AcrR family transcriptional regulator [Pseudonocardia sp. CA-107938]|uniref:TetR/AcrR family transcriptional regulator n=1 Tax=Pseudonocardia sp. CA-107938 TaxID=3240021 RepID=UPI003D93DC54